MGIFTDNEIAIEMAKKLTEEVEALHKKKVKTSVEFYESGNYADDSVSFLVRETNGQYAVLVRFTLTGFPSCPAIAVSHEMYVAESLRNKGIANFLQGFKRELARKYGCVSMQATTRTDNDVENHILEKYGWRVIYKFSSKHSGNDLLQWVINL